MNKMWWDEAEIADDIFSSPLCFANGAGNDQKNLGSEIQTEPIVYRGIYYSCPHWNDTLPAQTLKHKTLFSILLKKHKEKQCES